MTIAIQELQRRNTRNIQVLISNIIHAIVKYENKNNLNVFVSFQNLASCILFT